MRKEKAVKIEIDKDTEKTFTVFEVRPKDLFAIWNELDGQDTDGEDQRTLLDLAEKALPLCCTATIDDLKALYPSDIEKLLDAFKSVNRPFLKTAQALDLGQVMGKLKASIVTDWLGTVADSLKPATPTP